MLRPVLSVLLALSLSAGAVSASAGNWCSAGGASAYIGGDPDEIVKKIRQQCKPGDTVGIPGNSAYVIGTICDFTKTIHNAPNGLTMCVIAK